MKTSHLFFDHSLGRLSCQRADSNSSDSFRDEIASGLFSRPENQKKEELIQKNKAEKSGQRHSESEKVNQHSQHRRDFRQGTAKHIGYTELVKDGVFIRKPLAGSVFNRTQAVQFIVLHSTETRHPADAERVIDSWNNRGDNGRRLNPGAQFVVDRDGKIYTTASPDKATIHVNDSRTKRGIVNQNSVGIEIVRTGEQQYTYAQKMALTRLVSYLQDRYGLGESRIVTHGQIQPSTRRDPVDFDLSAFNKSRRQFRQAAQSLEQQKKRG